MRRHQTPCWQETPILCSGLIRLIVFTGAAAEKTSHANPCKLIISYDFVFEAAIRRHDYIGPKAWMLSSLGLNDLPTNQIGLCTGQPLSRVQNWVIPLKSAAPKVLFAEHYPQVFPSIPLKQARCKRNLESSENPILLCRQKHTKIQDWLVLPIKINNQLHLTIITSRK